MSHEDFTIIEQKVDESTYNIVVKKKRKSSKSISDYDRLVNAVNYFLKDRCSQDNIVKSESAMPAHQ